MLCACGGEAQEPEAGTSSGIDPVSDSGESSESTSGGPVRNEASADEVSGSQEGEDGIDPPRFDVAAFGDLSACGGRGNDGTDYDFSVIWIANSPEGTVSKIDTRTGTELARYETGPDDPDPSRTSVNLAGDVAVGNRGGSVTKIATRLEDCEDLDGDAEIRTSHGPDDVLAYGEDECVLWRHDVGFEHSSHTGGPRAIAWDVGEPAASECDSPRSRVWVGWRNQPSSEVIIRRLHGEDGTTDDEVVVDQWQGNWGHGTYGGAIDPDDNFWGLGTAGTLIRVDSESFDVDRWDNDGEVVYGMAIAADGNPWLAAWTSHLLEFDVATETFVDHGDMGVRGRGLAIDEDGFAWIAANNSCGLVKFDTAAGTLVAGDIALPGCVTPVGVSVDVDGQVWVVDRDSSTAYKVDPDTYATMEVTGLVSPYTYSDMTGAGLKLVAQPPG